MQGVAHPEQAVGVSNVGTLGKMDHIITKHTVPEVIR